MTGKAGTRARRHLVAQLQATLSALDEDAVAIRGNGHSVNSTRERLRRRIRELR